MTEKGFGRDQFHLVPAPGGEPAAKPGRAGARKPPLMGSRSRAAKLWFGEVKVLRGAGETAPDGTS